MTIARTFGQVGPCLASGDRVPQLFYADDGLLMANGDQGMRALTACLHVFCARSGMRPNLDPGKTEMAIFSVPPARRALLQDRHEFYIMGGLVRFVQQYKYIGCWFDERRGCMADLPKGYAVKKYKMRDDYYDCDIWNTKIRWPQSVSNFRDLSD